VIPPPARADESFLRDFLRFGTITDNEAQRSAGCVLLADEERFELGGPETGRRTERPRIAMGAIVPDGC